MRKGGKCYDEQRRKKDDKTGKRGNDDKKRGGKNIGRMKMCHKLKV